MLPLDTPIIKRKQFVMNYSKSVSCNFRFERYLGMFWLTVQLGGVENNRNVAMQSQ